MKIIDNRPKKFEQLKDGDIFTSGGNTYIKIYTKDGDKAIRLDTGDTYCFLNNSDISYIKDAQLIID